MDCQAPLSMGFPRQEWSGLPFPSTGDLPDPGIRPTPHVFPALAGEFLLLVAPGKPNIVFNSLILKNAAGILNQLSLKNLF